MVMATVSCWAGVYRCLLGSLISALLSSSPELGFLDHLVVLFLLFQCTPSLFSILALPTSHSYNSESGFQSLHPHPPVRISAFDSSHPSLSKNCLTMVPQHSVLFPSAFWRLSNCEKRMFRNRGGKNTFPPDKCCKWVTSHPYCGWNSQWLQVTHFMC